MVVQFIPFTPPEVQHLAGGNEGCGIVPAEVRVVWRHAKALQ